MCFINDKIYFVGVEYNLGLNCQQNFCEIFFCVTLVTSYQMTAIM